MARKAKSQLVYEIEAKDNASSTLRRTASELSDIDSQNRNVADSADLASGAFAAMGVAATAALVKMVNEAADLERVMANVSSLIKGDSTKTIAELKGVVSDTAVEFGVMHDQIGPQAYKVFSASIKDVDQAQRALAEGSKLMYTGWGSLDDAMKTIIDSMRSYEKHGLEFETSAGIIHNAIRIGITDLSEYGPALSRLTTLAESQSISFESLATSLSALTASGLSTAEAQTYLNGAIIGLMRPSEDLDMVLESISDTAGVTIKTFRGLVEYFEGDVVKAFRAVYDVVGPDQMIEFMGRAQGAIGVLALGDKTSAQHQAYIEGMKEIPNVVVNQAEAFRKQQETFNFQWNQFKALINDIIIMFGEELLPVAKELLAPIKDILMQVRDWPSGVKEMVVRVIGAIAIVGTLKTAIGGVKLAWAAATGVAGIGGFNRGISAGNRGIIAMGKNIGLMTAGIWAAGYAWDQAFNNTAEQMHGFETLKHGAGHQTMKWGINLVDWATRPARGVISGVGGPNVQGYFDELRDEEQERYGEAVKGAYENLKREKSYEAKREAESQAWNEFDPDDVGSYDDMGLDLSGLNLAGGDDDSKSGKTTTRANTGQHPLVVHGLFNELIAATNRVVQNTGETNMILQGREVGMGDQANKQIGVNL